MTGWSSRCDGAGVDDRPVARGQRISRPAGSCSTPRFPQNIPRSGTAIRSPDGVTRFCRGIVRAPLYLA